jgi:ATP-dependent Lhr-like helicase
VVSVFARFAPRLQQAIVERDVQRVGLSATVGNPEAILAWMRGTSRRPGRVVDPPKPPARRQVLVAASSWASSSLAKPASGRY